MFHVFVEGAADGTPEGVQRLAEAIGKHYGLPAADLLARLKTGRFRVKGNCDRPTAETYVRDLERLGARCAIEEANAANSRPTPLPFPAVRPATPPAGVPATGQATAGEPRPARPSTQPSALADQPPSRPSAPPSALAAYPRPSTPPPVAGAFTSGLSAAFSPESAPQGGLGALEREDAAFSLASVDGGGEDDSLIEKSPEPAFGVPASIGPAPDKAGEAKAEKKARPKDVPVDMFAPPDAESADLKVDIADDEKAFSARKKAATPPAGAPVVPARAGTEPPAPAPSTPALRRSQPIAAQQAPVTVRPSKLGPLADERVRTIAGVVLAILIGFLPAHLVAKSREASAYKDLDAQLVSLQDQADTPEAYAALDQTRATFLERKKDERRNIALLALVIWGAVGAGIAYGWFRRIPWDDL